MNFIDFACATVLKNMDVPVFAHVDTKKMFKKWSTKYLILRFYRNQFVCFLMINKYRCVVNFVNLYSNDWC